jgi:hypothetical protein
MIQQDQKLNNFRVVLRAVSRGLAIITLFLFTPLFVEGAILYLEPSSGQYYRGDVFIVEARIDTEGECINAVKVDLSFPKEILEVLDFSQGNSILTLWVKEPTFSVVPCGKNNVSCGLVSFIGGIPGGYCGALPGELGKPNLLGRIIFRAIHETEAKLEFLESSQILLNDGFGTPAKLITKGAIFTILPEKLETPKEEWKEELEKDNIPPEPFEIEIHRDPAIFEGKYFIAFSTTDKESGIDHYEVKEGKRDWRKAESPYLLEDQSLKSIIKVRAVDKAGNERIAEYIPPKKITWKDILPWIILIIVGIGIIIWLIAKPRETARKTTRKL